MKIQIDGKDYELARLKLNDLEVFEERFGHLDGIDFNKMSMKQIKCWIWLSLKRGGCKLTEEQVGEHIEPVESTKMLVSTVQKKDSAPLASPCSDTSQADSAGARHK